MYDVLPTLTDTVIGITSGTVIPDVTETLNDIAALFNFASLAVHVTIVVPIGKNDSDGGSQTGPDVTLTLSVTVGFVLVIVIVNTADASLPSELSALTVTVHDAPVTS